MTASITSGDSNKFAASHDSLGVGRITVDDDFVTLGNMRYHKHELARAFGGTLVPDRYYATSKRDFGAAAVPVGLSAFALTTFVLGLYYLGAMGITVPNVVVSIALFYAGAIEILAGSFCLATGPEYTFAGTVLVSYGAFWLAFGVIFIDSFGIAAAYTDPAELANATAFFIIGWAIFTFILIFCTVKSTVMFSGLFITLDMAFVLLAAANMTGNPHLTKAGGIFAILSSLCGWYLVYAGVANKQNSYFQIHPIDIPVFGSQEK